MIIDSFTTKGGNKKISLDKLTVFVGPNNCGKSQTLKDLASLMNSRKQSKIIDTLNFTSTEFSNIEPLIDVSDHKTTLNHKTIVGIGENFAEIEHNVANQDFENSKSDRSKMLEFYNRFRVVLLNSYNRANVINQTSTNGLENDRASNLLQLSYLDNSKKIFQIFQSIFKETFNVSIYLDYTALSQIALRVSQEEVNSLTGDTQKDRGLLKVLEKIDDQGEGYKSFAATILGLVSAKNRLVLLDEPEVFLHNAQQKQLGRWVGDFVKDNDTQLVIATHSPSFLEGLLSSGVDVNIQRLNRVKNNTSFNNIEVDVVKKFTSDPILSSQRVLDAVFQKAVVVCEGDTDRMIYRMVADKIKPQHEILFIHSHNKQTTPIVVNTLENCAVPVYSVVDIDIFHEDKEYEKIIDAHKVKLESKYIETQSKVKNFISDNRNDTKIRDDLKKELDQLLKDCSTSVDVTILKSKISKLNKLFSNWYQFKKQGINFISDEVIRIELRDLVKFLKTKNLYIVDVGELESWIPGNHSKGKNWINYAVIEINKKIPEPLKTFIEEIITKVN